VKTGIFSEPWSTETRFTRVDVRDVGKVAAIAPMKDRLNQLSQPPLTADLAHDRSGLPNARPGRTTMNDSSDISSQPASSIPPDDPRRALAVARPDDDQTLPHIGIVGDTYTILLTGDDTAGRYCLIDMHVPPGGGPAPHRHDFEEMFTVLQGEVMVTFRGESSVARTGETVNIPANAPHWFRNVSEQPARLLCMCSPAGQEEFFIAIGQPVASRTATPPRMDEAAEEAFKAKAAALAPEYRSELLKP